MLTDRRSGAPDWVCKHCVKIFQEKDALSQPTLLSIPRSPADKTLLQSESSPAGQSETKAAIAISSIRYQGSQITDIEGIEGRTTLAEEASNGHPKALANFDLRQRTRNASDQRVPFEDDRRRNPDDSASHIDGWMSEAIIVKKESMGDILSTPTSNSSEPLLPQAIVEHYGSGEYVRTLATLPPHIAGGPNFREAVRQVVTIAQPTPFKPAAMNGIREEHELKLRSSSSLDTSMATRHCTSQVALDANHSEEDVMSISPEKSPEKARSTPNTMTKTSRLQQSQETSLSKIDMQPLRKSLKHLTCYHWKQRGGCRYREDECQYAHWDTGMDEGKNTTCFWWWTTGHCKKSEKECLYAHRDTGIYAKPPPGYIPQNRKCVICLCFPFDLC